MKCFIDECKYIRTKSKVRVSPKDWRTVFDLMSANIIRTKSKGRVSLKGWRTVFDLMSAKLMILFRTSKDYSYFFLMCCNHFFFTNNSYTTDYQAISKDYFSYKNNAIATKKKCDMIENRKTTSYVSPLYLLCKSALPPNQTR